MESADILIAIDLGTTYTGAAWMTPRTPLQVINDWPGSGDRGDRKVPTSLIYNDDGTVSSWGFMCDDDDDDDDTAPGKTRREFFKIFIDGDTLAAAKQRGLPNVPEDIDEARRITTDYLRMLYRHLKETIETQIGRRQQRGGWADMAVSFLFSVPTTWIKMETINAFKGVIKDAGFGTEGARHQAQVDLTEAEAAAVATLKTSAIAFERGSLFLAVDAGGGTTDLALMRITSDDPGCPQMAQMAAVKGVGIGATLIDRAFVKLVGARVASAPPELRARLPQDVALRMARSHQFRALKHKFGERGHAQDEFRLGVEGLSHEFSDEGLGVEGGKMVFLLSEISSLFDAQIEGIMKRVAEQLDWLRDSGQTEQVGYVVLSGGLGSSTYVREKMQERLASLTHPSAKQVAVVPCHDPQLVVVRGLLLDYRQRKEMRNKPVLKARVARASYGVIVMEPFEARSHRAEEAVRDQFDASRRWAINQIHWLIKKGDTIDADSHLIKTLQHRFQPGELNRPRDTEIVISQNEPDSLPSSLKGGGASKLCHVKVNIEGIDQKDLVLKRKRGTCFHRGYKFYVCEFEVHVILAPADLRFELWFGGRKFSGNHEPIAVAWDEAGTRVGES